MKSLIARLERATGPDACWIWPRSKDARGRGRIWVGGKLMLAHRAVWQEICGPIPAGALLCHHCDNPSCVNPRHLYVGTPQSNVQDMMLRGRNWQRRKPEIARALGAALGRANTWSRGAGNPKAKLSPKVVLSIAASSERSGILAARYGVDRSTIQRIRNGKLWQTLRALKARL